MARFIGSDQKVRGAMFIFGLFLLSVSLYQNIVLELPYYYALFSVGMFLGYWTMAIIPYALYIIFGTAVKKDRSSGRQPLPS